MFIVVSNSCRYTGIRLTIKNKSVNVEKISNLRIKLAITKYTCLFLIKNLPFLKKEENNPKDKLKYILPDLVCRSGKNLLRLKLKVNNLSLELLFRKCGFAEKNVEIVNGLWNDKKR